MFVPKSFRGSVFRRKEKEKNEMEELKQVFSFPVEEMRALSDYMASQMSLGLEGKESDLKMIPSFVSSCATGLYLMFSIMNR